MDHNTTFTIGVLLNSIGQVCNRMLNLFGIVLCMACYNRLWCTYIGHNRKEANRFYIFVRIGCNFRFFNILFAVWLLKLKISISNFKKNHIKNQLKRSTQNDIKIQLSDRKEDSKQAAQQQQPLTKSNTTMSDEIEIMDFDSPSEYFNSNQQLKAWFLFNY